MTTVDDLSLALAYLTGDVDYSEPIAKTRTKLSPEEESRARQALVRLLDERHPPRRLLDVLAALFDEQETMMAHGRILRLVGRRKGPLRDWARELDWIVRIKLKVIKGATVEKAIAAVAEEFGTQITEEGLWDVWKRNRYFRDEVLKSQE